MVFSSTFAATFGGRKNSADASGGGELGAGPVGLLHRFVIPLPGVKIDENIHPGNHENI